VLISWSGYLIFNNFSFGDEEKMSTTVTSASGTIYVSGTGSSDFDSSTLIAELVEVKMAPAYTLDDQIETLGYEVSAWEEMDGYLDDLSDAAETMSSSTDESVFDDRSAYLSSASISDPTDVLAVTVDEEADLGVYEIEVIQTATSHKVASDEVTDTDSALGYDGVFTVQQDDGTATDITVTSDMTLDDLVDAINDVSSDSGVSATLLKSSDDGYTLMLSSVDTGNSITTTYSSGDDVLQSLGITNSDGAFANELQEAQLAELTVDGVTITSASNDIEDLLPGVSLSIYDDSEGSTITLEVGQDLDGVSEAITDFVDAYNTYREFAILNQTTDDDGAVEGAYLFGESMLRNVNNALYSVLSESVEIDGDTYTLADIGIEYDDDNYLTIDTDTLEEMLVQNADVVQAFFQQSTSVSDDDLYVAETPGSLSSGEYSVDIVCDADGNITSATLNGVELEVSDKTIKGADGTAYDGLRMVYTGDSSTTITMTVSSGIADMMMAAVETYAADDGLLDDTVESLEGIIDDKQEERDAIAEAAEEYEEYLISYYADLETAMEEAETQLALVEALFSTDS